MGKLRHAAAASLAAAVLAVSMAPVVNAASGGQDVVVVLDTTSSMRNNIDDAKAEAREIAERVVASNPDSRVGFVQYKDWASPMPNGRGQLAGAVSELPLTRDTAAFNSALNAVSLNDPGNRTIPEAVYSGIVVAVDEQPWRENVGRNIIVIGDAPADDPEYRTCLTAADMHSVLGSRSLDIRIQPDHGYGYNPDANVPGCNRDEPAGDSRPINEGKQGLERPRVDVLSPDGTLSPELTGIAQEFRGKDYAYGDDLVGGISDVLDDIIGEGAPATSSGLSSGSSEITGDDITGWIALIATILGGLGSLMAVLSPYLQHWI